jgi:hypothetical protein
VCDEFSGCCVVPVCVGANQVVEMNLKLGSNERCQGGYFTAQVDDDSTNTQCEVPTGLTSAGCVGAARRG